MILYLIIILFFIIKFYYIYSYIINKNILSIYNNGDKFIYIKNNYIYNNNSIFISI